MGQIHVGNLKDWLQTSFFNAIAKKSRTSYKMNTIFYFV